jgi:Pyridoxamine 5'-phosphate oxidase
VSFSLLRLAEQSVWSLPVLLVVRGGMTVRMTGQQEDAMSAFSHAEFDYLGSQRLGRLATVGKDGVPHVVPVAFRYNPTPTRSTSVGTTSPSARSSATSSGQA